MKYFFALTMILSVLLSACAATPEAPPTSTPKPTKTPFPQGVLKACLLFDGELVEGRFDFYDEEDEFVKDAPSGGSDCTELVFAPGTYWLDAFYFHGTDCPEGCYPAEDMILIDIQDGDVIEMDVEVFNPK